MISRAPVRRRTILISKPQRKIWLQHRAQTLALFGMFSLAVDYMAQPAFGITSTYNPAALTIVSALALLSNLAVLVYEIVVIVKTKRNPLTQEIYADHKAYKKNLIANGFEASSK